MNAEVARALVSSLCAYVEPDEGVVLALDAESDDIENSRTICCALDRMVFSAGVMRSFLSVVTTLTLSNPYPSCPALDAANSCRSVNRVSHARTIAL